MENTRIRISPDQLRELREEHIGRLLLLASREFSAFASDRMHECGYTLRPGLITLMTQIDLEGTHNSVIAERTGIKKESASHLIAELKSQHYVDRIPDPHNSRATLVVFTERGQKLLETWYQIKTEIEEEYASLLGESDLETLRTLLRNLLEGQGLAI